MIRPEGERPSLDTIEDQAAEAKRQVAEEDDWRERRREAENTYINLRFGQVFWPVVCAQLFVGVLAWIAVEIIRSI